MSFLLGDADQLWWTGSHSVQSSAAPIRAGRNTQDGECVKANKV